MLRDGCAVIDGVDDARLIDRERDRAADAPVGEEPHGAVREIGDEGREFRHLADPHCVDTGKMGGRFGEFGRQGRHVDLVRPQGFQRIGTGGEDDHEPVEAGMVPGVARVRHEGRVAAGPERLDGERAVDGAVESGAILKIPLPVEIETAPDVRRKGRQEREPVILEPRRVDRARRAHGQGARVGRRDVADQHRHAAVAVIHPGIAEPADERPGVEHVGGGDRDAVGPAPGLEGDGEDSARGIDRDRGGGAVLPVDPVVAADEHERAEQERGDVDVRRAGHEQRMERGDDVRLGQADAGGEDDGAAGGAGRRRCEQEEEGKNVTHPEKRILPQAPWS